MGQKWRTILWSWFPPPTCMRVLGNRTQVNRYAWQETSPTEPSHWLMAEIFFKAMETQKWESKVRWPYFKVPGTLRMIQFWFLENELLWTDGGKENAEEYLLEIIFTVNFLGKGSLGREGMEQGHLGDKTAEQIDALALGQIPLSRSISFLRIC